MAQCPKCQTELSDDFGLVDCPSCGAGLFIEFDGVVRVRQIAESFPSTPALSPNQEQEEVLEQEQSFIAHSEGSFEQGAIQSEEISSEGLSAESSLKYSPSMDWMNSEEDIALNPLPKILKAERKDSSPRSALNDLMDYGNSLASSARDGLLQYNLIIRAIDSAEQRARMLEVLCESKMGFDEDEIKAKIHMGELKLDQIPAVKASLIVQRLIGLSLQIEWIQHVIIQEE